MNISHSFIQKLFTILCIIFSVSFSIHYFEGGLNWINASVGILGGCALSIVLLGFDFIFKRYSLKAFNTAILGLFCGYLMAQAVLSFLGGILEWETTTALPIPAKFFIYSICAFFGLTFTSRSSEEFYLSIPFIEFKQITQKKKDILVDLSTLTDPRIIDLASTGLLDHHLILPRCSIKELYSQAESLDEGVRLKARQSIEVIKKLENMPSIELRYIDTDFPEIKDPMAKLIRLARLLDTHIMTSDINRIQQSSVEGIRIINIHMLSNALKPITQAGECINIKVQRYGKEARQGVGYLEDGTMVVVNGGAEYIGEIVKAHVLSVKHTSSGRMIFCNAAEEGMLLSELEDDYSSASMLLRNT